jgi:hypothetical protein
MSGCAAAGAVERPEDTAGTDVVDIPDGMGAAGASSGSSGVGGSMVVGGSGAGGGMVGGVGGSGGSTTVMPGPDGGPSMELKGLHVSGNRIVTGANQPVQLRGVNRSGTEYGCIRGTGIFDGPDDDASIAAMASWKINAVRVPLNETCWLGINGVNASFSGDNYKKAVVDYVGRLIQHQLIPILELHWSAPMTWQADRQQAMPDRDHSVDFWKQVAGAFAANDTVVFDPFNEPFPDSNNDSEEAWRCWRDGGTCAGFTFQAAGMQELVTAIRGTGALNLILLGGVHYASAFSGWLAHKPNDPSGNLAASWHVYNFTPCNEASCWNGPIATLALSVPVVATEIGQDDCGDSFIKSVMAYLDPKQMGYLAWTWDAWGDCFSLVADYMGTPKGAYGQTFKSHLGAL